MNSKIIAQLNSWRTDRNISKPLGPEVFEKAIEEEVDEYTEACRGKDANEQVDAIADISIFCLNELLNMGYNPELVIKKAIAHIVNRKQDPTQKADWEANGPSGKWKKSSSQDPETLYQPNYSVCKLGK